MNFRIFCFAVLMLAGHFSVWAQRGEIRGTIYETSSGEPLYGVTVIIKGTTIGTITDFDGKYNIAAVPGSYELQASFISFQTVTISGVVIKPGETTLVEDIGLEEDIQQLEEIVISAEALKDNEVAFMAVRKKSPNVLDGITAASFRKIGDSDAASAIKRVTGVSVEGGKYVYVRGLGDRYTKSILNGVDIPGLDPDRNTLQMDIFPTSVINNIVVVKSFTSDLPSDFVGGLVNMELKDLPDEKIFKISGGLGYNSSMHFNGNYLTYNGGSTDWLGFDDGTRAIPTKGISDFPSAYAQVIGRPDSPQGKLYRNVLGNFNPTLGALRQNSFMNYNLGLSVGDQIDAGTNRMGYIISINYKNLTDYYEGAEYGRYGLNQQDNSDFNMDQREFQKGDFGSNNILLSGLAGLSYKSELAKYKLYVLHIQNGESKAGLWAYRGADQGSLFDGIQTNLEYNQRGLTNMLLNGTHYSADGKLEVDWKVSPTRSRIEDPDVRFTRFRTDNGVYSTGTESGFPERIWRDLKEDDIASKIDLRKSHQFMNNEARLKFGMASTYKNRDYNIRGFQINPRRVDLQTGYPLPPGFEGDPKTWTLPKPSDIPTRAIFTSPNLWPMDDNAFFGTTYEATFIPENPNKYSSTINNMAFYVSEEAKLNHRWKAIIGIRMENYVQRYTGQNQLGTKVLDNEKVIDELGFFPSVNIVYGINDKHNLRLSFSRTTARPSFKEASYAEIIDPMTGRTFVGGFFKDEDKANGTVIWDGNLETTDISNFDIRWEVFRERAQMVAISGFYKHFRNPIEIVQFSILQNSFQPRNVGDGQVIGAELEFRQDIAASALNRWSLNGNVSMTHSKIEMSETEFVSRTANAREGQEIARTRNMAGQAPYLVNLGLYYEGLTLGIEAGLFYNVQGETLQYVGMVDRPDVYSVPFHSLNFNSSKTFGVEENVRLGIKVSNLLKSDKEQIFKSFMADDRTFGILSPGTTVSVGFSYSF